MPDLRFIGLTKSYGGVPALQDVSLDLPGGRVHALMGENGAGKSTFIKMIAGVVQADHMAVEKAGERIALRSAPDAYRAGFRFIHQELDIVPQLSVAENILLGHRYPQRFGALVNWPLLRSRARAALSALGVAHIDVAVQAGQLSTGDKMLIKIAAALVQEEGQAAPCLYVLDEPTAALTAGESEMLFSAIARLKSQGAAILYVSHRINEIMRICDDVTVLRDGRMVSTTAVRATSQDAIIQAMTGRDARAPYPPRQSAIGAGAACSVRDLCTDHLRDLTFSVAPGEILGIAGLSEAGQSEVLRLLLGLERPRSGTVQVLGGAGARSPAGAWARGVAYIPRERRAEGVMLRMPVRANALLAHLGDYGLLARKGRETTRTRALAQQVGLRFEGPEQPVGQLSGGNQQKVVFARAIAGNPKLLLLDEPTRGVDVGAKYEIHTLVRHLSAQGCAVILASSDLPELLGMSDRILILRNGSQAALLDRGTMTSADLLGHIYGAAA